MNSYKEVLGDRKSWAQSMHALQELFETHGVEAKEEAKKISKRYEGARALSVVDVVASRQRQYISRVIPMVDKYRNSREDHGLNQLRTKSPTDILQLRTSQDEGGVMQRVAAGLLEFGEKYGLESDDSICEQWAKWVEPVVFAPKLDPYVGSIKGIGPALFAYLRIFCGADALKPDVQTRKMFDELGFNVPDGDNALLLSAKAAAEELGTSMVVLDQLLWWATQ